MRRIFVFLCFFAALFFAFSGKCLAADEEGGLQEIDIEIPQDAAEYISPEMYSASPEEIMSLFTFENAAKTAISLLEKVLPEAMEAFLGILGLIVISAVLAALRESVASRAFAKLLEYVSVLCVAAASFSFIDGLFAEFETFIKQVSTFMLAIIPTMSALMLSSGEVSSSLVFGAVLSGLVMPPNAPALPKAPRGLFIL